MAFQSMHTLLNQPSCTYLDHVLNETTGDVWLGLSGGIDSVVLLHLLVHRYFSPKKESEKVRAAFPLSRLKVVHVHHGLSVNADAWQLFCQQLCHTYQIHFVAKQVTVQTTGKSLEEAARTARYDAFAQCVQDGDLLVLAHHANDQAETLLFRLLRGTGGKGMTGMPVTRTLSVQNGSARLIRPLLNCSKQDLVNYAQQHNLTWIEDESNLDVTYSRNFIRHHIMPVMEKMTPKAAEKIADSTQRLALDYAMLETLAQEKLSRWQAEDGSLSLLSLQKMEQQERLFWLRQYLQGCEINLTQPCLEALEQAVLSNNDKQPELDVAGDKHLMRYQNRLYVLPKTTAPTLGPISANSRIDRQWDSIQLIINTATQCDPKNFALIAKPKDCTLTLSNGHSRKLKKWLNDLKVPVWWREQLPYITYQEQLVAIGSLWLSPTVQNRLTVEWQPNQKLPWPFDAASLSKG
ncbi:tRNA lysidine(34) synthetase TilS [Marinomonas agarivorans]|nr:tRNA lysidine(34) synthetase TilS [Marinomonas agarivorans]